MDRHVAPLGHIILIPSQPFFALISSLMLRAQRKSNKYQFYSLWFDPIRARTHDLRTRGEQANHYTSEAVNRRRTDNTMAKRKGTKGQTTNPTNIHVQQRTPLKSRYTHNQQIRKLHNFIKIVRIFHEIGYQNCVVGLHLKR